MTLYKHIIDSKCQHKQHDNINFYIEDLPKEQQKYYSSLYKSSYCSIKLFSLVDLTMDDFLNKWKQFDRKIFNDLLIQCVYAIYLMNSEGYFHHDFHTKNVGLIKTKEKFITILNKKIPTHGYIVVPIDYCLVLHKKFILKDWEKKALKYDNDLFSLLNTFVISTMTSNLEIKNEQKINIDQIDRDVIEPFVEHFMIENDTWCKDNIIFFTETLYKIMFFDKRQIRFLRISFFCYLIFSTK